MRSFILMSMFTVALAGAATSDYREVRDLQLDAEGIDRLEVDAGAGNLEIVGIPGSREIRVSASIEVPDSDDAAAREIIDSRLELGLEVQGATALLNAHVDRPFWRKDDGMRINLVVSMPADTDLEVIDGSGSMVIRSVNGRIDIEDGSGSMELSELGGPVRIVDGSGSITAIGLGDDLSIDDGSGSIRVRQVSGTVTIDDGSGSIEVRDVGGSLVIVEDGSGGLDYSAIGGLVDIEG
ncbi:MAG: hypothetical protein R3192_02370 [Woeseiaceae bacterium]|nr:hypothetical protein [Woeseiaceae bacterium]